MSLYLCSDNSQVISYKFKATGIEVFSYEEALYHCYNYWKDSLHDFEENEIFEWIKSELNISFEKNDKPSYNLLNFISSSSYFTNEEFSLLKEELDIWENRSAYEKLKEDADEFYLHENFRKAIKRYKLAYKTAEPANICKLDNNIGLSYLRLSMYDEACIYLSKAYDADSSNETIKYNYIEALIFNEKYEKAKELLQNIDKYHLCYFSSEICLKQSNFRKAVDYLEEARELDDNLNIILKLCDTYYKQRRYDKMSRLLNEIKSNEPEVLIMKSKIYAASGNYNAAIRFLENILYQYPKKRYLWIEISRYYRLDYNLEKAEESVLKAIIPNEYNDKAEFELAKVHKAKGDIKEYQKILSKILHNFKKRYREEFI